MNTTASCETNTPYIILRSGKRYNNKVFETYEKARQYVRKQLRNTSPSPGLAFHDVCHRQHSNPRLSSGDFSIKRKR